MPAAPGRPDIQFITLAFAIFLGLFTPQNTIIGVDLEPKTLAAFARYVQLTEARIQREVARPEAFLYIEGLSEPQRSTALGVVRKGDVYMERLETRDASGQSIPIPDGLVHHWIGAVFIPGVHLGQVLDLVQDYNHHQNIYQPEVVRSRLLEHDGNDYKI